MQQCNNSSKTKVTHQLLLRLILFNRPIFPENIPGTQKETFNHGWSRLISQAGCNSCRPINSVKALKGLRKNY